MTQENNNEDNNSVIDPIPTPDPEPVIDQSPSPIISTPNPDPDPVLDPIPPSTIPEPVPHSSTYLKIQELRKMKIHDMKTINRTKNQQIDIQRVPNGLLYIITVYLNNGVISGITSSYVHIEDDY